MFDFSKEASFQPKCQVTHGLLPRVEIDQLPKSKRPFSTILNQYWSHTVDLLLPEDLYNKAWKSLEHRIGKYEYSKVTMSLSQLLEGDFFNTYIKAGNITMLSNGRAGMGNLHTLREGVLRVELPKEKYERAGLVGKPIPDGGRKHVSRRYLIEINLREPAMVRGKKGFDRIIWACKNVLSEPVAWLFFDHNAKQTLESGTIPLSLHEPVHQTLEPEITHHKDILVPPLHEVVSTGQVDEDDVVEILEWLGLVTLESPRVKSYDSIDPFLARYQAPQHELAAPGNLVAIRWRGFILGGWVRRLFVECLGSIRNEKDAWFALSGYSFRTEAVNPSDGYTILCLPRTTMDEEGEATETSPRLEYISWEMASTITHR